MQHPPMLSQNQWSFSYGRLSAFFIHIPEWIRKNPIPPKALVSGTETPIHRGHLSSFRINGANGL